MKRKIVIIIGIILFILFGSLGIYKFYHDFRKKHAKIDISLTDSLTIAVNEKRKVSDFITKLNGTLVDDFVISFEESGEKDITFEFINNEKITVQYTFSIDVIDIALVDDLTIPFYETRKVSDYIKIMNGTLVDDFEISFTELGKQNITVEISNQKDLKKYTFSVEVVDTVEPLVGLGSVYRVAKDTEGDLATKILCGDNVDPNPKCYIEGTYDVHTVGDYSVVFHASDSSGNTYKHPFIIRVYEPLPSDPKPVQYIPYEDIRKTYQKDNCQIGIDVSSWQGDIDFEKIKKAGVEFMIIRVGSKGSDGNYFVDKKFKRNIELAHQYNIPVGIYFYSYAGSVEEARQDAKWVLEQLQGYQIDLPIAFDWEDWASFNDYHISFFELSSMANAYLEEVTKAGYQGMLYSSKSYLENIWFPTRYETWLAHYTDKTNYAGDYGFWQLTSSGKIDGIQGAVDVDIYYP